MGHVGTSVQLSEFFCKPKTVLKLKVYFQEVTETQLIYWLPRTQSSPIPLSQAAEEGNRETKKQDYSAL